MRLWKCLKVIDCFIIFTLNIFKSVNQNQKQSQSSSQCLLLRLQLHLHISHLTRTKYSRMLGEVQILAFAVKIANH